MRTEQEVMKLITEFGNINSPIRAIIMNGSRVNKNVQKDKMQDYDIVYVVTNPLLYIEDKSWLSYFGEICIMQEPDDSVLFKVEVDKENSYGFLVQFMDGVRIDFTFQSIPHALNNIYKDKLTKIILDKDYILPRIPDASDEDYILRRPSRHEFRDCYIEFWWVCTYIAKGLYRNELLYAMDHLNFHVRPMLLLMLAYKAGHNNGYNISFGKNYKYLPKYLDILDYRRLEDTYTLLESDSLWDALESMMEFFDSLSLEVSKLLGYDIDKQMVKNTVGFIKRIKNKEI